MTTHLAPLNRFATFIVGANNRLAATAARGVAEAPGAVYNPLVLVGVPGTGKTHLLTAVGHEVAERWPGSRVEYFPVDELCEAMRAAIAAGQGDIYRRHLAEVALLLLDDLQLLARQRDVQAELVRVLDQREGTGRQLVVASTQATARIDGMDERLLQRLNAGLAVELGLPDEETRLALLRQRARERRLQFDDGVLEAAAAAATGTARDLQGLLNRLAAAQAAGERFDPGTAAALAAGDSGPSVVSTTAADTADEFSSFLTEVAATLADRVEGWRPRVAQAVLRWKGEGFRTDALETLLTQERPMDPLETLAAWERDAARLQLAIAEVMALAPDLAGDSALRDPAEMAAAEALLARVRGGSLPPAGPAPHWQLLEFVEAAGNRQAVHAARRLVEQPGDRGAPLVIVAGAGLGKTHLLHAIGNALAGSVDGAVACLGVADLAADFAEAAGRGAFETWRGRYRRAAALLLDDLHLLAGQDALQAEVAALIHAAVAAGRPVACTSTVPLAALAALAPAVGAELAGARVVELPAPDRELRQKLVERLLAAREVPDADLATYLAGRPADSVRAVQGLVQRVVVAAEKEGARPTAAMARQLLEGTAVPQAPGILARGPGVPAGVRSREKTVWDWPDPSDRVIEEWR